MRPPVRVLRVGLYLIAAITGMCCLSGNPCHAQVSVAGTKPHTQTKPILFETASIRPSREGEPYDQRVLPDGILLRSFPVGRLIWFAYCPAELINAGGTYFDAPKWVGTEGVDIQAKVSTEDAAEWQRETTSSWDSLAVKYALRELLADRYKLKAHTISIEVDGFALVMKKSVHKAKLVPASNALRQNLAKPSPENIPSIVTLPDFTKQFHNEPLSALAVWLSTISRYTVEDRTGLTGGYDFLVRDRQPIRPTAEEVEQYQLPADRWDLESLGLMLVPAKVHTPALIVDHIERPSPN